MHLRHWSMHRSNRNAGACIFNACRPTVIFADDSIEVIEAACSLLCPTYNVIQLAANGEEAVSLILKLHPDLAVLDICMPRMDGISAARKLNRVGTSTRIVLMTQIEDEDYIQEARRVAYGYVLKRRLSRDLLPALTSATAGSFFFSL